ncbi:MAG: alpha/beta fold hydrolase [Sphingobium sp.]|nr:alpha/beta fold hydrolase [Sphingobium sp.]
MRGLAFLLTMIVAGSAAIAATKPPILIERQGSFSAGGIVSSDPTKGSIHCDHGFVEYQIPVRARKMALFLWHSASVQAWQMRWDGGEGYQSLFLRRGFPVYLWDGPRVGRGNWGCEDYTYKAVQGRDQQNFIAWRLGPSEGHWFEGVQFPRDDPEAWNQATSARYDEFDIPKNAHLEAEAAGKAFDRIGPVVLVTNSAAGWRAMLAAMKSDRVKAIVAYENPAYVFPDGEGPQGAEGPFGPTHVPLDQFKALTRIPMQFVWGDNIATSERWAPQFKLCQEFVRIVNAHGGHAEILELPKVGIRGNTHLAFADLNNVAVADQLSAFLKRNKLDR